MAYTNSSLIDYKRLSPNHSGERNHEIDTISIHCVVGQCSVETIGSIFADPDTEASSNYGIGYDGKKALYVEEKNRSWCTSSRENDNRAITIEVASDTYHPYAVNSKAYNSLIELLVDICKRNNIKKLVWSTNKNDRINHKNGCNMTVHRDYDNKACPGDYLYNRHGEIAYEVNKRLGVTESNKEELYRVGTAWENNKCKNQKGAFKILNNAKTECDKYTDYCVFDSNGNKIYTSKKTSRKSEIPSITYKVRAGGRWYSDITNLNDYAGVPDVPITDVAIKVSEGSVKYRVHVKGGNWLGWITKYDLSDPINGYAGNGLPIDAIQVYYYTPDNVKKSHGYLRAKYHISPTTSSNYWGWQYDTETTNGQDGYAGYFGYTIDKLQITLSK